MPCSTRAMMIFPLCICLFLVILVFPDGCVCRTEFCHKTPNAIRLSVHRLPVNAFIFVLVSSSANGPGASARSFSELGLAGIMIELRLG
jgi:hypothetical protein